jgi:ADP-heptose:LPS heptosyltransferase
VSNLLAVCPGGANTLASTLPALEQCRQALPAVRISLWTTADAAPLAQQLSWLHELLESPAAWTGTLLPLTAAIENRRFDAAIIFTAPHESPYPAAYTCYLAGIPIRAGQSCEFGGSVLSPWIRPANTTSLQDHHRHLLKETLPILQSPLSALQSPLSND